MTSQDRQPFVDTPLACHYAADPAHRPRCTLTATVRLGAIMLCASCNATRSTLGKGQTPVPLPAGRPFDVLGWVVGVVAHRWAVNGLLTVLAGHDVACWAGRGRLRGR